MKDLGREVRFYRGGDIGRVIYIYIYCIEISKSVLEAGLN